jgi:hypothetical protein
MLKEIQFSKDLSIYTTYIGGVDNNQLSIDLEKNCETAFLPSEGQRSGPGIQCKVMVVTKNINNLEIKILEILRDFLKLDDDYIFYKEDWIYISDNSNKGTSYHTHNTGGNLKYSRQHPQWTFVYYVSMPNNLLDDDGTLYFKDKNNNEFSILPKVGQLILFGTDVQHRPALNRTSTKKRIVYASNIGIIDRNKNYIKKEKTLL